MQYNVTTLPNGLRVITEDMPTARSVAVGCWVNTGSRDEHGPEAGTSHFLEHLLFKGSERMTAREISEAFDSVGARHNAFTSKEYTCYWARLRDADTDMGLEILSEMIQRPAFRQVEIDSERHVVLEEINMNEDDPTDVAHEQFVQAMWGGHPLAPPILGTRQSITEMTRETIAGYWGRRYAPTSTVVAAAGRVDHDRLVDRVADLFGDWEGDVESRLPAEPVYGPKVSVRRRDTEQAHIVIGSEGLARDDDRRFALTLVDHVLGGGMSSRLFREIREKRGLAYAVHGFRMPFQETGAVAIYVGTTPSQAHEVLKIIREELKGLTASGLSVDELDRAKGHVQGSLALSLEDPNSRMNRIGRTELTGIEHLSFDEVMERIDAVSLEDALAVAQAVYSGPYVIGAVGPFDDADLASFVA
jgi:predicted Zn-dependent peptidase